MVDWNDPESCRQHLDAVGAVEYHRDLEAHNRRATVAATKGHAIRPVTTSLGTLFSVIGTGQAFVTVHQAEAYAESIQPEAPGDRHGGASRSLLTVAAMGRR